MFDLANTRIGIVGLGYVGLPLAVEFGKQFPTIGLDINAARIRELQVGHDSTLEVAAEELRQAHHLRYTDRAEDLATCNVYIVTVPTPVDGYKRPDFSPLIGASTTVGRLLKPGDVAIYESTVYPGATEEICVPILERESSLRFNADFFAGYSPERINPGDKDHRVTSILKVTSGSTPEAAAFVDALYRRIITAGTHRASSIRVAEAAKVIDLDLDGGTIAIQGYGSVGRSLHKLAEDLLNLRVVAVSDSQGGIYNPNGLSFKTVSQHKRATGSVVDAPDTETITNEELLATDVTMLFPAALENVITDENAGRIRAKIVAEMANGPTTPEADKILHDRGIFVLPDLLCNAGGVTVSYFEQVQNAYDYYWTLKTIHQRLDRKMSEAFHAVHRVAELKGVHHRLAAYLVAVERVAEAAKLRGWV